MTAVISLRDVRVERGGRTILSALDLDLAPGERLAVLGANGAGKTTLLRSSIGLEPVIGEVRLFGLSCRKEADFRQPRLRIGLLFQDADDQLFSPTVVEDVAFGPMNMGQSQSTARMLAREVLEEFGLSHLENRPVHALSGGEKRMVCLAGLWVMKPDALLLDEPTNALDSRHREEMLQRLSRFPGAMMLVSHDEGAIRDLAARAVHLVDGTIHQE